MDDISARYMYQVALEDGLSEKEALTAIQKFSRDNARTPFQWSAKAQAGFTTGTPWLNVNPNYKEINLEEQLADPDSVFHYYQRLAALRKDPEYKETLVYGELIPYLEDTHNVMAYYRKGEDQTILVMANYQKEGRELALPAACKKVLLNNLADTKMNDASIWLEGYQAVVLLL